MDRATFDKYVNERYFAEISWYDRKSMRNQIWYRTLQWGLIVLSASTPVVIALAQKTDSMPWVKPLSLVTSVLVAILATSLKTFKFEENWVNYRTTCKTLKKEIHFLRNTSAAELRTTRQRQSRAFPTLPHSHLTTRITKVENP